MGFWDFHDTRYSDARRWTVVSLTALVLGSAGVGTALFYNEKKARTWSSEAEPAATPIFTAKSTPAPEKPTSTPERKPTPAATPSRFAELKAKPFDLAMKAIDERKYEVAEEQLKAAINSGERVDESLSFLGVILKENQKYAEAIEVLSQGIQKNPQANRYFNRAECYDLLGETTKAKIDYDTAVEKNPKNPLFTNKRYLFMIRNGRLQDVADAVKFQYGLGVVDNTKTWIMAAAALVLKDGKSGQAVEILQQGSQLLSRQDFNYILRDPIFQEYRDDLQVRSFFAQKPER